MDAQRNIIQTKQYELTRAPDETYQRIKQIILFESVFESESKQN